MNKKFKAAILGLGIEGRDALGYLMSKGYAITVYDQKNKEDLDTSDIDISKIEFKCGVNYLNDNFVGCDLVVRSPGFYRYHPALVQAEKKGIKITSSIKLFFENCKAKIIGVTGTKGKGTTSTLIYEILKAEGRDVYLVGNIGKPYLELLSTLSTKSFVVMEMSSFQLIDLNKSPDISVVLNITLDHMDWHKSRKEYVEAKKNIVLHQQKSDLAVINYDYKTSKDFSKSTNAKPVFFSRFNRVKMGCFVDKKNIFINNGNKIIKMGDTSKLLLRGEHNWENVCAAITATYFSGSNIDVIRKTIYNFKGLEHRLELVRKVTGVSYYNDSFSTNPQPTMAAVESFSETITLILGGSDKGLNYDELGKYLGKKDNVKNIILIGQIADNIEKSLKKDKPKYKIYNLGMTTMSDIVKLSSKITQKGGVVLLSPATASFGMFKDYKDRGYQFKNEVNLIKLRQLV